MKRFFQSIAIVAVVAFAAASCENKALAPAEPSTPVLAAPDVTVSVANVTDDSFSFTVAPQGESSYYSYLVTSVAFAPDSASLYAVKYSDVAQGTVKYADKQSFTSSVSGLSPNTTYYVYAVTSSKEGNVGHVVSASCKTSDGVNPEAVDFAFSNNIVQILFSEDVEYVEGKEVTAVVYAQNYRAANSAPVNQKAVAQVTMPAANIAQFVFPDITIPGSWYLVSFPEGTFVDSAGNPCPALESVFKYAEDGSLDDEDPSDGVWAYIPNAPFSFKVEDPEVVTDYKAFINVKSENMLAKAYPGKAHAQVVHTESGVTTTTEYDITGGKNYGVTTLYTAGFRLEAAPNGGDLFTISVDEGAIEDIYGNKNAAFEIGPVLYSYGFTVADVCGTYENSGESGYGATYNEDPWTLTITESDDATKGNVMISSYYGFNSCKIYGDWNGDTGVLTIEETDAQLGAFVYNGAVYFYYLATYYGWLSKNKDGRHLQLYMTEVGSLEDGNDFLGYYYEAYKMPASGNVADLTENDFLGSDYNIFFPEFVLKPAAAVTAAPSTKTYYPMLSHAKSAKLSFTKVLEAPAK